MQRKVAATAAAQRHMARVAAIGCIVCIRLGYGESPCNVHHIREGRIARDDFLTLPMCRVHHVGAAMSIHMDKEPLLRALGVFSEFDLLADVMRRMAR